MDEARIQDHSSPESFRRGEDYYLQGAVLSVTRSGDRLHAEVAGSDFTPYNVWVSLDAAGGTEATCSCPYDWGGWCKHIVAVLLSYARDPERVRDLPALEETLSGLDRERLQELLLALVERDPSLAGVIEGELSLPASPGESPVNPEAIRRRVRSSIHDAGYPRYEDYHVPGGDLDEARRTLDGAWSLLREDAPRDALAVLGALTEGYLEAWETLEREMLGDYGGELVDFFEEVGAALTEALLSADDLTAREREDWSAKLDVWLGVLDDYGVGYTFGAAQRAAKQGWSYPPLVRVLEGGVPDDEFFEELLDDPLTTARLNVLERRDRHEEYLRLSEAAGEVTRHAAMLGRLGRIAEAVEYSTERLATPAEALAVAGALREAGDPEAALQVGERGLSLEGRKGPLAAWVRDLAEGMGRPELALRAAGAVFRADPSPTSYRRVRELAGERWPRHRDELLEYLRREPSYYISGPVDIFLHEGLVEDAIALVEKNPVGAPLARVADAAIESHPEWVINNCRERAEEIMDEGRSKYYGDAITWLEKARDAYLSSGREEEWLDYLGELTNQHWRKYKLCPMLEDLG